MADDLGADLDQFLAQRRQRPLFHGVEQCERPHEVAEVLGKRIKLESDGIVVELAARQRGFSGPVLALLDVLLGGAALFVERNHPLDGRLRFVTINLRVGAPVRQSGVPRRGARSATEVDLSGIELVNRFPRGLPPQR